MRKIILALVAAVIVVVIGGAVLWHVLVPGPMAFAGSTPVPLADYHAADPTGVPAELKGADVVKHGEYLAIRCWRGRDTVKRARTRASDNGLCQALL
jgi:hypothetical protein